MPRTVTDRYLPPDHPAFVAAEPATGRLIVIAPTRAACETIEIALGLHISTVLEKQHGKEIARHQLEHTQVMPKPGFAFPLDDVLAAPDVRAALD